MASSKQAAKKPPDLFANATPVAPPPIDPFTTKKRKGPEEIELGSTLDTLAAIKALTESLGTIYTTCEKELKDRMVAEFVSQAIKTGKRPDSFRGVSAHAEASCELKKRASNVYLSDEEKNILDANEIPSAKKVTHEAIDERFFFNPALVADASLAAKISAALGKVPELQGQEILMKQVAREEQVRFFLEDGALEAVCAIKDGTKMRELLRIAASLAIKPGMKEATIEKALEIIRKAGVKL